jgi:RNA-directed DNA polymerase
LRKSRGGGNVRGMGHNKSIKKSTTSYQEIITLENLLLAWKRFQKGKRGKKDVQVFEYRLMDNLLSLQSDLQNKTYVHGGYYAFKVNDPKPRDIHKASVRDRVVHHLLYQDLAPFYFPLFIHDSYSCQDAKGTHKALQRFEYFARKVGKNNTKQVWVLKCDIKKFFASIDQGLLVTTLKQRIVDADAQWLLEKVIDSFYSTKPGKGLPLGNLTSQLLVNIYMNEFDRYVKQTLTAKYYIRYADDFVVLSQDRKWLQETLTAMEKFLQEKLQLAMHPNKVSIETLGSGSDFLGWVHFPEHRVLRTVTKTRMLKKLSKKNKEAYRGMLGWGNGYKMSQKLEEGHSIKNTEIRV